MSEPELCPLCCKPLATEEDDETLHEDNEAMHLCWSGHLGRCERAGQERQIIEELRAEVERLKAIDIEWVRAARKLNSATTEDEHRDAFSALAALRLGFADADTPLSIFENLRSENAELQAIVDRLAVTKDGVRYGSGDKVYYVDPTGYVQGLGVGLSFKTDSSVPDTVYWPWPVYSTRAAAESAAKRKA